MTWQEGDGIPYAGFYNGNVKLMLENGTYADFRPLLERRARLGKMATVGTPEVRVEKSLAKLAQWDEIWEKMPLEKRLSLRSRVAEDSAIREVVVHTAAGPRKVLRRTPDENNNMDKRKKAIEKKLPQRLPSGTITKENIPASLHS